MRESSLKILEDLSPNPSRKYSEDSAKQFTQLGNFEVNPIRINTLSRNQIKEHFNNLEFNLWNHQGSYDVEEALFKNLRNIGLEFGAISDPDEILGGDAKVDESPHSIDLSASEETKFDTQNMLSLFVKKSN